MLDCVSSDGGRAYLTHNARPAGGDPGRLVVSRSRAVRCLPVLTEHTGTLRRLHALTLSQLKAISR